MEVDMVKIDEGTALVCEMVLGRYLDVLAENPACAPVAFKQMIVDASLEISRARQDHFLAYSREPVAMPSEMDSPSLIHNAAR
jgi:hypothetical protein